MNRRLLFVLALGAALVGAPSHVSAASNDLLGAQVSPTTGTTSTTFTFSVRYEGRFAASAVTATAGTVTLSLTRVAGTGTDGTWRGSSGLPQGTWPVVFAAVALQGNSVSLTGPTVTVLPDAVVTAAPSTWSGPPSPGGATIDAGASDGAATATDSPPPMAPAESATPAASGDAAPEPMSPQESAGAPVPAAGDVGANPTSSAGAPDARPDASTAVDASSAAGAPAQARQATSPGQSPGTGRLGEGGADLGNLALFLALGGLALVAVSGSGLLLVATRRRRSATVEGPDPEDAATVVQRRTLRRARVRLDEDPIVAALGLPDADGAAERRARRAAKRRGVR